MTDKEKTTTTSATTSTPKPKAKESKHVEFLTNDELAQVEARLSSAAAQLLHSQDQVDNLSVLREALQGKLKQIR